MKTKKVKKVAILTAGGLAPCLSTAIAALVEEYTKVDPKIQIICYVSGYKGLLEGRSVKVTPAVRKNIAALYTFGGSPIGNSRVKLTNVKDGVDVLHTIGGDDTNTAAADLAAYLAQNNYALKVVGMPKTIDNDVYPIRQSLGAWTAAEQGARFFANVVGEQSANPRMLIVHEVMGRNCGYLTAATAAAYRKLLDGKKFLPELGLARENYEVHGVYIPELAFDVKAEAKRLRAEMDKHDNVNIFVSEGAGVSTIIKEMEARGEEIVRDAFGHPRLDKINPGAWFAKQFAELLGAEKTMVQKSGYFSRAAASNKDDVKLIKACAKVAVKVALDPKAKGGVVGQDENAGDKLRACEFERIKGGKPFDTDQKWFNDLLKAIGQKKGARA